MIEERDFHPRDIEILAGESLDPAVTSLAAEMVRKMGRHVAESETVSLYHDDHLVASVGVLDNGMVWGVYSQRISECLKEVVRAIRRVMGRGDNLWTVAIKPQDQRWVKALGFKPVDGSVWVC